MTFQAPTATDLVVLVVEVFEMDDFCPPRARTETGKILKWAGATSRVREGTRWAIVLSVREASAVFAEAWIPFWDGNMQRVFPLLTLADGGAP